MRKLKTDFLENSRSQAGNALIYVLIALALIGTLTVLITNQGEYADSENLSDEEAELHALDLIQYAAAAQNVIDTMSMTGTGFSEFSFINPTSATAFNTAPHIHKVYHPQGGGLNYEDIDSSVNPLFLSNTGWQFSTGTNVGWTPSGVDDILFSAVDIAEIVCGKINEKITGTTTIPVAIDTLANLLFEDATVDLDDTACPNCEGYPTLCFEDSAGDFGFYNVVLPR